MKTIGILGGLGPQATIDFELRLHTVAQKHIPQHETRGYPPVITYYLRHPPMRLLPDGSVPSVLTPHPQLLRAAKQLGARVDVLVIPSNTPHLFLDAIEDAAGRPILDMVDLTMREVERRS